MKQFDTKTFPTLSEVLSQLRADRDIYHNLPYEERYKACLPLVKTLNSKLHEDSSALESLTFQYAFRRFCILTGVAENISFSATIPYDANLLNNTLAHGRWNVHVDVFSHTIEVSTDPFN